MDGLNTLRHLRHYRRAITAGQRAGGDGGNGHSALPAGDPTLDEGNQAPPAAPAATHPIPKSENRIVDNSVR